MIGVLSTGGGLVFSGDPAGNLIAFDGGNGRILWHAQLGSQITNSPQTFLNEVNAKTEPKDRISLFGPSWRAWDVLRRHKPLYPQDNLRRIGLWLVMMFYLFVVQGSR